MSNGRRAMSLLFMSAAIVIVMVLASALTFANDTGAAASGGPTRSIIIKVPDPDPLKPAPPQYKGDIVAIAARNSQIQSLEESLPALEKGFADAVAAARSEKTWNPAAGVMPKRPAAPGNQNGVEPAAHDRYIVELHNYCAALRRQTSIIKGGRYSRPGARTYRTAAEFIRGVTVPVKGGGENRAAQAPAGDGGAQSRRRVPRRVRPLGAREPQEQARKGRWPRRHHPRQRLRSSPPR